MKHLRVVKEALIEYALPLGPKRWFATALALMMVIGSWLLCCWLPLHRKIAEQRAILNQESTMQERLHSLQEKEAILQQELLYNQHLASTVLNQQKGKAPDCLEALLAHAKTHAINVINYQPQLVAYENEEQSDQTRSAASIECIGAYENVYSYLTTLMQAYPYLQGRLLSLTSYEAGDVRAQVHIHTLNRMSPVGSHQS